MRARGYVVVDVALALLVGRVSMQRPALLLIDIDAEGAVAALRKLIEPPNAPLRVMLLAARQVENSDWDAVRESASAVFTRPIDVAELTRTVEDLIGKPAEPVPTHSLPPSARSAVLVASNPPGPALNPSPVPPPLSAGTEPPRAPSAPPPVPPDLDLAGGEGAPAHTPTHTALSHEIVQLLQEAERRVGELSSGQASAREAPTPEERVDAVLPPDVLAALEEPLEDDAPGDEHDSDEIESRADSDTGSATGTGRRDTTGHSKETPAQAENTGAAEVVVAARAPFDPAGTAVTDSGRTGVASRATSTGVQTSPPGPPTEGGPQSEAASSRAAKREAATPKPPRPPDDAAGDSEPPPTPRPPIFSEAPRTLHEPMPASDAPQSLRSQTQADSNREASTAPPPSRATEPPPSAAAPQTVSTSPPLRPSKAEAAERKPMAVPPVLGPGDAIRLVATAVRTRFTGALAFEVDEGIRRIVLRDGDFVTASSGVHGESLVAFLVARGDLPAEAAREGHKLPMFGRHASAALIAQGHLAQDQLWPVLRAHAEWIVGQVLGIARGTARSEEELPGRLQDEPAVFGGATGAEVLVEIVRRVVSPEAALERLGGVATSIAPGAARHLLGECALPALEAEVLANEASASVRNLVDQVGDPSFASALYALAELGVVNARSPSRPDPAQRRQDSIPAASHDALDEEAIREKVRARRALVDEGDYFAVLGLPRTATGYEIRRAYTELRREYEPSRLLTASTADLLDELREIVEVLDEAYEILRDQIRRERYRRAIEATP